MSTVMSGVEFTWTPLSSGFFGEGLGGGLYQPRYDTSWPHCQICLLDSLFWVASAFLPV